jgi:FMN-dependent NADH-azoreductase
MKLLHVDSSILGANSVSRAVTEAVVDRLKRSEPGLETTYRDLSASPLPHLTLAQLPGDHPLSALAPMSDAIQHDRAASQAALGEFLAADIVVIGAPMYNFAIPSQLKAWIDRILIPGKTFRYSQDGVKGLAGNKRVIVVVSRGGFYGPATPSASAEHTETYLRTALGFIGITAPEIIIAEGVQQSSEKRQAARDEALRAAANLAFPECVSAHGSSNMARLASRQYGHFHTQ